MAIVQVAAGHTVRDCRTGKDITGGGLVEVMTDEEALLLKHLGRASDPSAKSPEEDATPRRGRYARRDMRAED